MSKIRVLIVDDSLFVRKMLLRIFESEPTITVVGTAKSGKEAIEKVVEMSPDVVTLDIMMPEMDGIEALKTIMEIRPTPVLMLSQYAHEGAELTLHALELGAMDFVDKSTEGLMDFFGLAKQIVSKIKAIAGRRPSKIAATPSEIKEYVCKDIIDVVAVGSSTGGPTALQMLLPKFPREIEFGIVIVQHMPIGFTGPLAKRLDSMCSISIKEAEDGDKIEKGLALIAPSGLHMKVYRNNPEDGTKGNVKLDPEPSTATHRPSVDVLFSSVAQSFGNRSLGVLLTGMGSDGAMGMRMIKEKGGFTFAQDEATSTIFGMPRVAIEKGAVDKVVPIISMAEEILKAC